MYASIVVPWQCRADATVKFRDKDITRQFTIMVTFFAQFDRNDGTDISETCAALIHSLVALKILMMTMNHDKSYLTKAKMVNTPL